MGAGTGYQTWDAAVHEEPDPVVLAKLIMSHGLSVARERWPYTSVYRMHVLFAAGQKQLGFKVRRAPI